MVGKNNVKLMKYLFADNRKDLTVFFNYNGKPKLMSLERTGIFSYKLKTGMISGVSTENLKQIKSILVEKINEEMLRK